MAAHGRIVLVQAYVLIHAVGESSRSLSAFRRTSPEKERPLTRTDTWLKRNAVGALWGARFVLSGRCCSGISLLRWEVDQSLHSGSPTTVRACAAGFTDSYPRSAAPCAGVAWVHDAYHLPSS